MTSLLDKYFLARIQTKRRRLECAPWLVAAVIILLFWTAAPTPTTTAWQHARLFPNDCRRSHRRRRPRLTCPHHNNLGSLSLSFTTTCLQATAPNQSERSRGGDGDNNSRLPSSKSSSGRGGSSASSDHARRLSANDKVQRNNNNNSKPQQQSPQSSLSFPSAPAPRPTRHNQQTHQLQQQNHALPTRQELTQNVQALKEAESYTAAECDTLLASCVAADAWDTVLDVLDLMTEAGWGQTHATYTASLQACAKVGNAASAFEIWQAMQQACATPANGTDVGFLLQTLCTAAKDETKWYTTALQVLETFLSNDAKKNNDDDNNDDSNNNSNHHHRIKNIPRAAMEALLREMAFRKDWKRALRLLQTLMEEDNQSRTRNDDVDDTTIITTTRHPSAECFRWTIEACIKAGQPEQAAQVLTTCLASEATTPTRYTTQALFARIIPNLARNRHWRKALQMLDLLERKGYTPTLAMYNPIMVALGKAKEFSQAKRLMKRLKDSDLYPDLLTYNSLMAAAAHRWKEALVVLDECHREPGVEPDVYTYTSAIRACAKGGKTSRALTLLRVVQDKELPLDAYVYTAAMEACSKGKLWERSLELLEEMQEKGIAPTEVTYSVAITACGNAGEWERSLGLLERMRSTGLAPNLFTYNGAISAIAKSAKQSSKDSNHLSSGKEGTLWKKVIDLLQQMQADCLEPDGWSYSSAISCCGSEGRWEEALELMDRMYQGGPTTRPNKIAYTAAISSCGRNGQDEHALRLFTRMKEEGLAPDRVTYNAVFSALRVAKKADLALELWDEMLGVQFSRTITPRKVAAAQSDNAATPDMITVTDCIGALSADDTLQGRMKVDRVLREAVERGILLRNNRLDSFWEVDLSGMTLPVARAAVRYILQQISKLATEKDQVQDLTLITGVGVGSNRTTSLREFVQEVLEKDFDPPLKSSIPKRAQGTVVVEEKSISHWLEQTTSNNFC